MKKLLIALLFVSILSIYSEAVRPGPVIITTTGGGTSSGTGGTGGVLTNNTIAAVIANFYTNSTPHWIEGEARLGTSTAGRIQCAVTNSDNTLFFHYQNEVATVGALSNTISFKVPPGGWWKFIGLTTTATDGSQQLLYMATNGSVTYATTAGTVVDGVTQAGLEAGSYATGGKVRLVHNGVSTNSFTTITAAANAASAGDLVIVSGGTYVNEFNLLRKNVNYHFEPGVLLTNYFASNSRSIFDDIEMLAGTTNRISGRLDFYWSQGAGGGSVSNYSHAFKFTNLNSKIAISIGRGDGESYANDGEYPHLFYVNGAEVDLDYERLDCSKITTTAGGNPQVMSGIWWLNGRGRHHGELGDFANYALWEGEITSPHTNDLYMTSDLLTGYIYSSTTNPLLRAWYDFKEMRRTTNGFSDDGFGFIGGRRYLRGMKISTPTNSIGTGIAASGGAEVWASLQKMERNSINDTAINIASTSKFWGSVLQFSDSVSNANPVVVSGGFMSLSDASYLGKSTFLLHSSSATNTSLRGLHIDTSSGTRPAMIVQNTGIVAVASYFKSSAATNSIVFTGAGTNADIFPSQPFGFIEKTNYNATGLAIGYNAITNFNYSILDCFTANTALGALTNKVPGFYRIRAQVNLAADSTTSAAIHIRIKINGTITSPVYPLGGGSALFTTDILTYIDQKDFTYETVVFIPSGSWIQPQIYSDTAIAPTVHTASFIVQHL